MSSDGTVSEQGIGMSVMCCMVCQGSIKNWCPYHGNGSPPPITPFTGMKSLRDLLEKMDLAIAMLNDRKGQDKKRNEQFATLAESQGKLLAGLNETQQGILELTDAIKTAFKEQRAALDGLNAGIAQEIGELRSGMNEMLDREAKASAALPGILEKRGEQFRAVYTRLDILRGEVLSLAKPPRKRVAKQKGKR